MTENIWAECLPYLQDEFPAYQFNTWLRPLQAEKSEHVLYLYAPNKFVLNWVADKYLDRINSLLLELSNENPPLKVILKIGSASSVSEISLKNGFNEQIQFVNRENIADSIPSNTRWSTRERASSKEQKKIVQAGQRKPTSSIIKSHNYLNKNFSFDTFVEGKSNQLARAASIQVAENPGGAYNPLFLYGDVGLGKTHLMHAVGNQILVNNPEAKVVYLHSERFVQDMVKALQLNAINEFKKFYRSVDALLIDDIQFFSKKERSQEEFFHTFNALLEGGRQMILTCDCYPKEIDNMEDRLKSRFGWGLTVMVEPPELETRVAILMKKAEQTNVQLSSEAAFFIAQKIRSNVRELEGSLKLVAANAHFRGEEITPAFIRESLKDLLAVHEKQVSIDNIQRKVAEYYKIKVADLHSKRRTRTVTRPRQMAMSLAKDLTNHSLPEIGDAFGGRDHTTVLHACKKIKELKESDPSIREDHNNFMRILTT